MACNMGADPTRICRICTQGLTDQVSENMYDLLNPRRVNLSGMLTTICPAVFSRGEDLQNRNAMPERICSSCVLKIEAAYELHQTCIESDRKLCEMFVVKQEEMQIEVAKLEVLSEYHEEHIFAKVEELQHDEGMEAEEVGETPTEEGNDSKIKGKKTKRSRQKKVAQITDVPNLSKLKSTIGTSNDASNGVAMVCVFCKIKFKHTTPLKIHLRIDHASQVFPCDSCHNVYLKEEELADHKLFHETGKPYACQTCGKRYINGSSLRAHRATHKEEFAFLCPTCGKAFPNNSSLDQHMLRHAEKKFACDQCPSAFFTKGDLKMHQVTHTKEKNFCCDVCCKRFTMKSALVKHVARAHSDNRPTYPCDVCDQKFSSAGHMRRHKLIHTGEKPYKCTECDRSFTQSNDLVKHSKTHFGDTPYQCDRCDESFRFIANLRDHYKVHVNADQNNDKGAEQSDEGSSGKKKSANDPWFTSSKVLKRRSQRKPDNYGENSNDKGSDEELEVGQSTFAGVSEYLAMTYGNN